MHNFIKAIITLALLASAFAEHGSCQEAPVETPGAKTKHSVAEPDLRIQGIKELAATGRPLSEFVPQSVSAAMELRDLCLANEALGTRAKAIEKLSLEFASQYSDLLKGDFKAPPIFDFSSLDFESEIRGSETCPEAAETFGPFEGKWFGRWAEFDVDHHWSRVVGPDQHSFAKEFPDLQIGWQFAWIGDGYGVNHCLSFEQQGRTKRFILGYTEHLQDGDFTKIVARRPHVGIHAGSGKLIWITAREVFFEETHSNDDGDLESYSIIGFNYGEVTPKAPADDSTKLGLQVKTDASNKLMLKDGFVARYSRDRNRRESFRAFPLKATAGKTEQ